jgi:hypothetical protein
MKTKSTTSLWIRFLVLTFGGLLLVGRVAAQPMSVPYDRFWRVNGPVYDITVVSNVAYLGGGFNYAGPMSGNAGWADLSTGAVVPGFPVLKGQVYCFMPDGQGGWFVGGTFEEAEIGLTNLVHILPNRTINRSWTPNPNDTVWALALGAGHLYVGGEFTQICGGSRSYLVSLDPQTARTNNWAVRPQNTVQALALAGDTLYVGGQFTTVNSQSRQRLAAVDANTGVLKDWSPGLSGGGNSVNVLVVQGNLVYVGGDFTTCGAKPRNRIAAVDAVTGGANNWNPNASASVNAIVVASNTVYVGGLFTAIGGRNRNYLAALQTTTGQADANWDPNPSGRIQTLLLTDNDVIAGGFFVTIAGTNRASLAAFDRGSGGLKEWQVYSSSLQPNVAVTVSVVAEQDGILAIGGDFASFGGVERKYLAALDLTTGMATSWNPGADKDVYTLALGGTSLFVGGTFNTIGGSNMARLAAINLADGQVSAWNPKCSTGASHYVFDIVVVENRVFVGGQFTSMGGESRVNLAELSVAEAIATAWNPSAQNPVRALLVHSNWLYVAGEYRGISGGTRSFLTAFALSDGQLVTDFDPKPDAIVRSLALQGDRLYVGGDFTLIANQSRSRLAAISPATGQEIEVWNPDVGVTGQLRVYSIAPVGNTIYVGGSFSAVGGEFRKSLAGVTASMASASGWDPSPNKGVNVVVHSGNDILVGGEFATMGTKPCPYFAVFSGNPSILAGTTKINSSKNLEMQVTDGDGRGTSLLVQATDGLENPSWQTIQTLPVFGFPVTVEDTQAASKSRRFYRLVVTP